MKKTKLFGLALVATMVSISACSNDAEEVFAQESEIKLTSEITPSRAVSNLQSTVIAQGQQVGITTINAKNNHNNAPWDVGANGSLVNNGDKLYWGKEDVSFYAYHPYNEDWEEGKNTFSVQIDQSTAEGYLNSDLLFGISEGVAKTNNEVELPFLHLLSKINITLSNEEISNSNKAIVYICNTNINVDFNLSTSASVPTSASATQHITDIKVGEITENSQTISAIIIPQTIEAETKFIKIEFNSKNYYFILGSEQRFNMSQTYSFNLRLKDKEEFVELSNLTTSVEDWTSENSYASSAGESDGIPEIYVETAGTLSNLLNKEENYALSYLKLFGKINTSDLSYIKENFSLISLDLSGTSYDGSSISLDQFYAYRLSLPTNIETVTGEQNIRLNSIVIPANVNEISASFSYKMEEIHCMGTTPPEILEESTLYYKEANEYEYLKIYVPNDAVDAYKANAIWNKFEIIGE